MGNQPSSKQHKKELTFSLRGTGLPPLTDTSRSLTLSPEIASPVSALGKSTRSTISESQRVSTRSENTVSSLKSGSSSLKVEGLHENLMRCQHRDPLEIYELVNILGEGSMGSVCKVRKRSSAVGGSARPSFVRSGDLQDDAQGHCCIPLFGNLHKIMPRRESSLRTVDLEDSPVSVRRTQSSYSPIRTPTHESRNSMVSFASSTRSRKEHYYALKSIHLDQCASQTFQRELLNEVAILRELDHAHIARALETYECSDRLFIVLELCSGGDLYARDPYTEDRAAEIVSSVLSAVSYLHSKGIIHRDLKYENIMFVDKRPDAEVKLIDFGLSQKFAHDQQHMEDAVGTVYTMAPELLTGHYNAKADVWSVGVIAFMLLSSSMPFYGKSRYAVMKKICKGHVKFSAKRWTQVSKYGKGLVRHLLESDPTERPSADRALKYTKSWRQNIQPEEEITPKPITGSPISVVASPSARQLRWKHTSTSSFDENVEMMDRIQASIQAFAQYNTLKKLALMVIAYKSTASEIGWLRSTFNQFDLLQNGEISLEEFTEALSEVYDYTPQEMEALFCGMDVDGTGSVKYTEFLAATIEAHGSIEEDRIADAFDRIDCDDSGYITIQNLRDFLGDDVPHSYLEDIIDDADLVRDNRISYDEFLELWDSTCYEKLRNARHEVEDRRVKRSESLMMSFSEGTSSEEPSSTDEDEDEDVDELPAVAQAEGPSDPILEKLNEYSHDVLSPMTPVIHNTQMARCGPVECFSQRKALSLRAGWM